MCAYLFTHNTTLANSSHQAASSSFLPNSRNFLPATLALGNPAAFAIAIAQFLDTKSLIYDISFSGSSYTTPPPPPPARLVILSFISSFYLKPSIRFASGDCVVTTLSPAMDCLAESMAGNIALLSFLLCGNACDIFSFFLVPFIGIP